MYNVGNPRNYWRVSKQEADLVREQRAARIVSVDAEPQRLTIDMNRTAVIVVDMQNDFCTSGGWIDYIGGDYAALQAPIAPINRLLSVLRDIEVPIIWLNWGNRTDRMNLSPSVLHVYNGDGEGKGIGELLPMYNSPVLEKYSWGAAIVDELQVEESDIFVDKYRMSGFWDTPLDSILRNLRVDTLLFAGVNLDQCVMATLQDAVNNGYDSILLEDCCATNSPTYCAQATIFNVKQCYGFVAQSSSFIRAVDPEASISIEEDDNHDHSRLSCG